MKILIFGASGMIGHRILLEARAKFGEENIYGIIRKPKFHFEKYEIFNNKIFDKIDVLNWNSAEEVLDNVKPDFIINALGLTLRRLEIGDLEYALRVNSFFPRQLLKWAQRNNAKVIHLSTDCVFDGAKGHYYENSQPSAQDNYGRSKFLGEIEGEKALTLRFSCIGRELDSYTELLEWFLAQRGKKIKGYSKAMYSGITSKVVAEQICRMIHSFPNLEGLYQISSEPISKYDLLCLAREVFQLEVEIEKFDNYISDKTLVYDKFQKETGYKPLSWKDMMKDLSSDEKIVYKAF